MQEQAAPQTTHTAARYWAGAYGTLPDQARAGEGEAGDPPRCATTGDWLGYGGGTEISHTHPSIPAGACRAGCWFRLSHRVILGTDSAAAVGRGPKPAGSQPSATARPDRSCSASSMPRRPAHPRQRPQHPRDALRRTGRGHRGLPHRPSRPRPRRRAATPLRRPRGPPHPPPSSTSTTPHLYRPRGPSHPHPPRPAPANTSVVREVDTALAAV